MSERVTTLKSTRKRLARPRESRSVAIPGAVAAMPAISVIIPVRNDAGGLDRCLGSLAASRYPHYEVIVVDDASTDESAAVAASHRARVIRLPERVGPGAARNRGASEACHDLLFFLDADVTVEPDTLATVAETFLRNPDAAAAFGSYDQAPGAQNVLSQYRNLLHHYIHQTGREDATTFWSGCGAIRRPTFLASGGFDPSYDRPSVEDIELGTRLRKAGHRIVLNKNLQVKHLKRWSLWSIVRCDFWQRGVPWTLLIHREGSAPDDLNLRRSHRLAGVLATGLLVVLVLGALYFEGLLLGSLLATAVVVAIDRLSLRWLLPDRAILLAVILTGIALGGLLYRSVGAQHAFHLWLLGSAGLAAAIAALNLDFYLFCARLKGPGFALLVLPLHIFYFAYASLAFSVGTALHVWRRGAPERLTIGPAAESLVLPLTAPTRRAG
jgi:glycosyltransferase involved in cell wall biosynthesis